MTTPKSFTQLCSNVKSFFRTGRELADALKQRSPTLTKNGHGYIARNVAKFDDNTGCLWWGTYQSNFKITPYMRNLHQMDSRYATEQTGIRASRFVWQVINQHYDRDHFHVRHLCANSRCMQPAHLALGTSYENQRDRVLSNRGLLLMPTWPTQDEDSEIAHRVSQQPERRLGEQKTPWPALRLVYSAPRIIAPSISRSPNSLDR